MITELLLLMVLESSMPRGSSLIIDRGGALTNDTCPNLAVITPSSVLTELLTVSGLKKV